MVKQEFALIETGSNTPEEYAEAFFDKKPLNYTTRDIRIEHCDKCQYWQDCGKCFIKQSLDIIYKIDAFA